jgi:hypothetical protein
VWVLERSLVGAPGQSGSGLDLSLREPAVGQAVEDPSPGRRHGTDGYVLKD